MGSALARVWVLAPVLVLVLVLVVAPLPCTNLTLFYQQNHL